MYAGEVVAGEDLGEADERARRRARRCTESSPPRITAGRARNASAVMPAVTVPAPIGRPSAAHRRSTASAALAPQAMANTRPTEMPWASAASWSKATARMAMPVRVRKNRKIGDERDRGGDAIATYVQETNAPPIVNPSAPHGMARLRG